MAEEEPLEPLDDAGFDDAGLDDDGGGLASVMMSFSAAPAGASPPKFSFGGGGGLTALNQFGGAPSMSFGLPPTATPAATPSSFAAPGTSATTKPLTFAPPPAMGGLPIKKEALPPSSLLSLAPLPTGPLFASPAAAFTIPPATGLPAAVAALPSLVPQYKEEEGEAEEEVVEEEVVQEGEAEEEVVEEVFRAAASTGG